MSFIATPATAPREISNTDFFPTIDLNAIRAEFRLDGTVTDERLASAARMAMFEANRTLADWRATWQARDIRKMEDVPSEIIDGQTEWVMLYRQAVGCWTAATMVERYRSYDATGAGPKYKTEMDRPLVDELRRDGSHAIRAILGFGHCTVELL